MMDDATDPFGAKQIEMPVGIVIEKRPSQSRWISHTWKPVAILPGAAPTSEWRLLSRTDDGVETYHIATLPILLHRKETEAYLVNLSTNPPCVYVVLEENADPDDPDAPDVAAVRATVSPFEAQDFLDTGEDIVEPVAMPEGMIAWLKEFADRHHVQEIFKKRKRKPHTEEEARFGKQLHPVEQRYYDRNKLN